MTPDLRERVDSFLGRHHVMTLATNGHGGIWAAAVFYAYDGQTLHFISSPSSRHAADLVKDANVAVTIQRDYDDWPQIMGIQAEGRAFEVPEEGRARARALYVARYPFVGRGSMTGALAAAFAKVRWYSFVPRRLLLIDNARGFGNREEMVLE
ncbi:MAG: pyridoxamine 5'-phosphate oxidase [Alphaproteobacteria bacterium]|nr:pyridoxamine 5'-phosphate oxidase [Alphaproteobacteria bacterium]